MTILSHTLILFGAAFAAGMGCWLIRSADLRKKAALEQFVLRRNGFSCISLAILLALVWCCLYD